MLSSEDPPSGVDGQHCLGEEKMVIPLRERHYGRSAAEDRELTGNLRRFEGVRGRRPRPRPGGSRNREAARAGRNSPTVFRDRVGPGQLREQPAYPVRRLPGRDDHRGDRDLRAGVPAERPEQPRSRRARRPIRPGEDGTEVGVRSASPLSTSGPTTSPPSRRTGHRNRKIPDTLATPYGGIPTGRIRPSRVLACEQRAHAPLRWEGTNP
jgi:hypothetical protein